MRATISYTLIMKQWVAAASQLQGPKLRILSVWSFVYAHCIHMGVIQVL